MLAIDDRLSESAERKNPRLPKNAKENINAKKKKKKKVILNDIENKREINQSKLCIHTNKRI
jgi:hypothetical protein